MPYGSMPEPARNCVESFQNLLRNGSRPNPCLYLRLIPLIIVIAIARRFRV